MPGLYVALLSPLVLRSLHTLKIVPKAFTVLLATEEPANDIASEQVYNVVRDGGKKTKSQKGCMGCRASDNSSSSRDVQYKYRKCTK